MSDPGDHVSSDCDMRHREGTGLKTWLQLAAGTLAGLVALLAAVAGADASVTLGTSTQPSGSSIQSCGEGDAAVTPTLDPGVSYTVPAGGGAITAWQTYTGASDSNGFPLTFLVMRPGAAAFSPTIVGMDTETLNAPDDTVASFPLTHPIPVQAGDLLGFYQGGPTAACFFDGTGVPSHEFSLFGSQSAAPVIGGTLTWSNNTPLSYMLDLSATLDNDLDAGVSASAGPANATVGFPAELTATVTNNGPAEAPIDFTDTVPAGLTIDSAVAGAGTCTVSNRIVTCSITALGPGQSAPVAIVVTPTSPGAYAHAATVSVSGFSDPVPGNNAASATLQVAAASGSGTAQKHCIVPPLAGTPPAIARRVLVLLNCAVGGSLRASSKTVAKGFVVGTIPAAGAVRAAGTSVRLTLSSGPPKRRKRR